MAELFDRYSRATAKTKRNSTCETYMFKRLKKHPGHMLLSRLTREEISGFRDNRLAEGLSASTVRNYLHLLSAVVNMANNDWGFELPYNPVRRVSKPKVNNARDRRLEPGEEQRLLD